MGIVVKQVTLCTCDICGSECDKHDGEFGVQVNGGDGRDVGPAYVRGTIFFEQPYGCTAGILCHTCKIKWLARYLKEQEQAK